MEKSLAISSLTNSFWISSLLSGREDQIEVISSPLLPDTISSGAPQDSVNDLPFGS